MTQLTFDLGETNYLTRYRVNISGPHVGGGGCGKSIWADSLAELEQQLVGDFCMPEIYPPIECDGCVITATIFENTIDTSKKGGHRFVSDTEIEQRILKNG